MIAVVGFLFCMVLLGWILLGIVQRDLSWLERIGLSYGLGSGVFTLGIFLASLLGFSITIKTGATVYLILAAIGLSVLLVSRRFGLVANGKSALDLPLSWLDIALIGSISAIVTAVFLITGFWPPYAWDALAIWVFKGKLIAAQGSLDVSYAAHSIYPLNLPLQMAFLYLLGGFFVEAVVPFYFLSLVVVFYCNLRQFVNRTLALGATLFLSTIPYILSYATIGMADVPFAFHYVVSALYLFRYLRESRMAWLILSAIFVGLGSWTRLDGSVYFAINLLVLVLFRRFNRQKFFAIAVYGLVFAILWSVWTIYENQGGQGNYLFASALSSFKELVSGHFEPERVAEILEYFRVASLPPTQQWGILWVVFPIVLLLGLRRIREHAPLLVLIALNALGWLFTLYATDKAMSLGWWLDTNLERRMIHWAPLVAFYLGISLGAVDFSSLRIRFPSIHVGPYAKALFAILLFAVLPVLGPSFFWDASRERESVYLLFEFDQIIRDGILYPRWAPDLTFGYGYPFFNIYGPGAFYLSEGLHLMGFDFAIALKSILVASMVLSGLGMFGFVRYLSGSSQTGFLAGLAYVYVPHIFDVYRNATLAVPVALVFLPLVLWGTREIVVHSHIKAVAPTALSFGALLLTHSVLALVFAPFLGIGLVYWIVRRMAVEKRAEDSGRKSGTWRPVRLALVAHVLGVGLAAIHLLPAALEFSSVNIAQFRENLRDYAFPTPDLNPIIHWLWSPGYDLPGFGITVPRIVIASVIWAGMIFVAHRLRMDTRRLSPTAVLVGFLILFISYPALTRETETGLDQPPTMTGLMQISSSASGLRGITAWVSKQPDWSSLADVYVAGKRVKSKIDYTEHTQDVLWVGVLPDGLRTNGERVAFTANEDNVSVTFNVFYYPGWHAYLADPSRDEILRELPITPVGELGRIQVRVPRGQYRLILRFEDTAPRAVGAVLSALSVVIVVAIIVWQARKGLLHNTISPPR